MGWWLIASCRRLMVQFVYWVPIAGEVSYVFSSPTTALRWMKY